MNNQRFLKIFSVAVTWLLTIVLAAIITVSVATMADNPLSKFNLVQKVGMEKYSQLVKVKYDSKENTIYHFDDGTSETTSSTNDGFVYIK